MSGSQMFGSAYPYSYPIYNPINTSQIPIQDNNIRHVISGRLVNKEQDIIARTEVPIDGSLAIFPKTDSSAIYVKYYNRDGNVETKIYIPAPEGYTEEDNEEPTFSNADIMKAISEMNNRIDGLQKNSNNQAKNQNNKNNKQNQGGGVNAA